MVLALFLLLFFFITQFESLNAATTTTSGGGGGGALYFDGVDDLGTVISSASICGVANPFDFEEVTMEMWMFHHKDQPEHNLSNIGNTFFSQSGGAHLNFHHELGVRFAMYGETGDCFMSYYDVPQGEWAHIAATYGGGTIHSSRPKKILYVNGEPVPYEGEQNRATELQCSEYLKGTGSAREQYWVGGTLSDLTISDPHRFILDEVRVWSIALTQSQIKERMHRVLTSGEISSLDLVLYWDMDGSDLTTELDRSGNDLHLELGYMEIYGGYQTTRLPTRVPSSAPLGGTTQQQSLDRFDTISFGLKGWDPVAKVMVTTAGGGIADAGVTATVRSLPAVGQLSLTAGGSGALGAADIPLDMNAGQTLMYTPEQNAQAGDTVAFNFTIAADGATASPEQTVVIKIEENHPPIAGSAGNAIHFGEGVWGTSSEFTWPLQEFLYPNGTVFEAAGGGPVTVEMWSYITEAETGARAAAFVVDSSFGCKPDSSVEFCNGRLNGVIGWGDWAVFNYGDNKVSRSLIDMSPTFNQWTHFAWSSCGADLSCNEPQKLYVNGKLAYQGEMVRTYAWGELHGLLLGLKAAGSQYHRGIIEEFRMWTVARTQQEIVDHMHVSLSGGSVSHPGLFVYYPFNEVGEEIATTAKDASGNTGYDLTFGGCYTNVYRNTKLDPCFHHDRGLNLVNGVFEAGRPPRVRSAAPVGGYMPPVTLKMVSVEDEAAAGAGAEVVLEGQDLDGDAITFHITVLPERGTLLTGAGDPVVVGAALPSSSVRFVPTSWEGGVAYATLTYEVKDVHRTSNSQQIQLNVECKPGTSMGPNSVNCELCPLNFFNPVYAGTCSSCPAKAFTSATGQAGCICEDGYEWQADTLSCREVGIPCKEVGCGDYAHCSHNGFHCECDKGYDMKPGVFPAVVDKRDFHCQIKMASTGEQRVFWTISSATNLLALILIVFTLSQYVTNPATSPVIIRSYLAVLVPDLVLSLVYWPFHFSSLLRGEAVDESSCHVIAFITYGAVVATFTGPITVAYVSYKKVLQLTTQMWGQRPSPVSTVTITWMLLGPWVAGFILAGIVGGHGLLGSYRGLICYATTMDDFLTGGITFLLLGLSCGVTMYLYVKMHYLVAGKLETNSRNGAQRVAVMNRGRRLVAALFFTWAPFSITGVMALLRAPMPVWVESFGAILISVQPIVDSYMVLSTHAIRAEVAEKLAERKNTQSVVTIAPATTGFSNAESASVLSRGTSR